MLPVTRSSGHFLCHRASVIFRRFLNLAPEPYPFAMTSRMLPSKQKEIGVHTNQLQSCRKHPKAWRILKGKGVSKSKLNHSDKSKAGGP